MVLLRGTFVNRDSVTNDTMNQLFSDKMKFKIIKNDSTLTKVTKNKFKEKNNEKTFIRLMY